MKIKLLKKLRKRFGVIYKDGLYYPVDYDSLHWSDDTCPYFYLPQKTLKEAQDKRREIILESIPKKEIRIV